MTDKNIVDDYYSTHNNELKTENTDLQTEKKPKVAIKGKIKNKKEPEKIEEKDLPVSSVSKNDVSEKKEIVKKEKKEGFSTKTKETKLKETKTQIEKDTDKKEIKTQKVLKSQKPQIEKDTDKKETGEKSIQKKEYFTGKKIKDVYKKDEKSEVNKPKDFVKPKIKKDFSTDKQPVSQKTTTIQKPTTKTTVKLQSFTTQAFEKERISGVTNFVEFNNVIGKKKVKTNFEKEQEESRKLKAFKKEKFAKSNSFGDDDDLSFSRSNKIKKQDKIEKKVEDIKQNLVDHSGETVIIGDILSVKELSEKIGVPLMKLITEFMKNGMKVTINSKIDFETASIISDTFNIKLQKDISSGFDVIDILDGNIQALIAETDPSVFSNRAPVISIMGHVDHGKTSLLDHIRKTKVADKEAGGITQSIGAYQVRVNDKKITFLDTPGHEAFTIMRARGAKSTDIAILVVAADEGVKPQTVESINHAREAGIPIIVAINKMDKEGANPDFVKGQLAQNGLQSEDWGGDVPMIPVSAKTGLGIDDLLDIILLVAEMQELKANPNRQAVGTVIESHLDMKFGPVATILINTGTLSKGDSIVCKGAYGKVKVLKDYLGKNISSAEPSVPVLVVGLDSVVEGGDIVQVVSDIEKARTKALEYKELIFSKKAASASSIEMIMSRIKSGSLKQLKIVLKSDTNGSLEALKGALIKLSTPETKVMIIHSGVGNITEGDILMCQGSRAILIGYNVDLLGNTKNTIEDTKIEFISSKVIYHITDRVEKIVTGMLDPKEIEVQLGYATVAGIFYEDKGFMILGLKIKANSKIEKNASVKIIRKDKFLGNGKIENLKSGIIDVNDLEGPIECGIKLKSDVKLEMGDMLEIFKIEIQK